MKNSKFLILILVSYKIIFAQPKIDSIEGNLKHGETIIIRGSEFGEKSPAGPVLWDDCTESVALSTKYDEYLPTNAQQGDYYNMQYRLAPFRSMTAPNKYIKYIIAGAHATNSSSGQYSSGNNVSLGVNLRSFNFFVQYWYRIDPQFDEENHPSYGDNMKELCLSGAENEIYGGNWGYVNWCNSTVPDVNYKESVRISRQPVDCPDLPYACSNDEYVTRHANPINAWIKFQWEGGYNNIHDNPVIKLTTYPDGVITERSHYGNEITTYETLWGCGYPDYNELRFLGIGGFARVPRFNNGENSFRYFSSVYIDSSHSRVMFGDRSEYNSCTTLEPQIPLNWDNNSIRVSVNLGSLPETGQVYVFVFDSANNFSAIGFPVEFGGTTGPSKPTGIRIVN